MVSPSRLAASSASKKTASPPSIGSSSKLPAASDALVSSYRLGTAATIAPKSGATVRSLGDEAPLQAPPAHVLPEHVSSSEDNDHNNLDPASSNLSATGTLIDGDNNSGSASSPVKVTKPSGVPLRPKARAPKKTLGKRPRADSNATSAGSNKAAVVPAKKRVRSSALMRSAPRATSTTTPGGLAGNSEFMNFTATIFIIQLGPDGPQFHAHESVLKRSPKLAEEIDKAKANKRATKQNILPLMPHDVVAFEQMLQFLYKDKFLLSKNKTTPIARLEEFKELMSLAKHYVLPCLQKQVVKLFSTSKMLAKIPPGSFFDWAEDMYYEELDHEKGPFKVYLSKVAPTLMKAADEATRKDLAHLINNGGGFAEQLFMAATTALDMQKDLMAVKKEEKEESGPVRPRTTKGKGKEPVRQTARKEASNAPADQVMEDEPLENYEPLFVQN